MSAQARRARGSILDHDIEDGVAALERTVEGLSIAIRARQQRDADDAAIPALRHLRDRLASHALAARVLVSSGASDAAVAPLLRRARAIVESSSL